MQYLLLGIVALTPLLPATFDFGFEQIKVIFFILTISFLGLFWVLNRGFNLKWTNLNKASFLFIIALFVTSISGADLKPSFLGKDPYFQGFILYAYLFLVSLIV